MPSLAINSYIFLDEFSCDEPGDECVDNPANLETNSGIMHNILWDLVSE